MIVAAAPRAGGTKFCMDLAEEYGLKFFGEVHPRNCSELGAEFSKNKAAIHETRHNQICSINEFFDLVEDHSNHVVLLNHSMLFALNKATFYLMRKNFRNCVRSMIELALRGGANDLFFLTYTTGVQTFAELYTLVSYVERNNIKPIWYEDYFNNKPCNTPLLDAHPSREIIWNAIEEKIKLSGIAEKMHNILDNCADI